MLAPSRSDADLIVAAAAEASVAAETVADMASLRAAVDEGAGAAVLVDAGLTPADVAGLREALGKQPPWSALPILLIAADVERDEARQRFLRFAEMLQPFANAVHLAERPLDPRLLVGWFDVALVGRRRQYAARGLLEQSDLERVDVTEGVRAQRARQVLSEATTALFESLDAGSLLHTLSQIVVKDLADCCEIVEVDEHGQLRRLACETSGARGADEAADLLGLEPAGGSSLAARVLRSGRPMLVSDVARDWPATQRETDELSAALAKSGVCSLMIVPLVARGRPLGVLGAISTRPDRRYDARDLVLAEELGRRAAIALDNARLHREAEAALRARDEVLAEIDAFLDASPVGFLLLDQDLRFRRVNAVYARWVQKAPDEILGRTHEEVAAPDFEAQGTALLRRVLRTGESILDQEIVGELPRGSGRVEHHLVNIIPVLGVDGTPRGVGVVVADVTRLKHAEEELRQEAAFRERFIGVLAHDLRSPLHAIVLSAGALLRQGEAPPIWARTVGRIVHAAERMERMIGSLLDLVRSREGGGIRIDRRSADVADVVRGVVVELEAAHPGRRVTVSAKGDTRAELDPDRLAEVVSNLATNALAHSPADTVVNIDVRGREGDVALSVHNTGAPIPPEMQKKIFMPFQRGAATEGGAPPMRGLGLGLYIVGEITRAHGGTVTVCSTPDEGTTFTVRLPRVTTAAVAPRP